jgi:hypothetical protein
MPKQRAAGAASSQLTLRAVPKLMRRAHILRLQTLTLRYVWDGAATDRQNQRTINP